MILVDSSMYIEWLRKRELPEHHLANALRAGEVVCCGIIRIEVLRGLVADVIRNRMQRLFAAMIDIPLSNHLLEGATELAWRMDRDGFVASVPDLIIAQAAMQADATLITRDRAFARIPGLKTRAELPRR